MNEKILRYIKIMQENVDELVSVDILSDNKIKMNFNTGWNITTFDKDGLPVDKDAYEECDVIYNCPTNMKILNYFDNTNNTLFGYVNKRYDAETKRWLSNEYAYLISSEIEARCIASDNIFLLIISESYSANNEYSCLYDKKDNTVQLKCTSNSKILKQKESHGTFSLGEIYIDSKLDEAAKVTVNFDKKSESLIVTIVENNGQNELSQVITISKDKSEYLAYINKQYQSYIQITNEFKYAQLDSNLLTVVPSKRSIPENQMEISYCAKLDGTSLF